MTDFSNNSISQSKERIQVEENGLNKKKPNLKKNYFYNLLYQIFLIIAPFITTPYVSRVLTTSGIGKYSYSFSIATYFTIFASLGFGYYAQRIIARKRDDKYHLTKTFWEIVLCRLIPVFICLITNVVLCLFCVYQEYTFLMWVFNINIVAVAFDISFLYQGKENFGSLLVKNITIRVASIISIFIFVKSEDSLFAYALISALSVFLTSLFMWISVPKVLMRIKINVLRPLSHLKGTLVLFLPTIAVSVYTVLDKTLIGLLISGESEIIANGELIVKKTSDLENGYYEQSEKIVKMAMVIITSLGSVMIPRNSNAMACGNFEEAKKNIIVSSSLVLLFAVPISLGLIVVADNFIPWFLGDGYEKSIFIMKLLSPLVLILGFSNVLGLQYLIPSGKDREFTFAIVCGAVVNFLLNIFFIKIWWSIGAAIATLLAETVVTSIMFFLVRKEINFLKIIVLGWKYYLSGCIMFISCFAISSFLSPSVLNTLIIVVSGVLIYFTILLILRDKTVVNLLKKCLPFFRKK